MLPGKGGSLPVLRGRLCLHVCSTTGPAQSLTHHTGHAHPRPFRTPVLAHICPSVDIIRTCRPHPPSAADTAEGPRETHGRGNCESRGESASEWQWSRKMRGQSTEISVYVQRRVGCVYVPGTCSLKWVSQVHLNCRLWSNQPPHPCFYAPSLPPHHTDELEAPGKRT